MMWNFFIFSSALNLHHLVNSKFLRNLPSNGYVNNCKEIASMPVVYLFVYLYVRSFITHEPLGWFALHIMIHWLHVSFLIHRSWTISIFILSNYLVWTTLQGCPTKHEVERRLSYKCKYQRLIVLLLLCFVGLPVHNLRDCKCNFKWIIVCLIATLVSLCSI